LHTYRPFYLTWKAREYGQNTRFIELAGEINTSMPDMQFTARGRAQRSTQATRAKVLILGLAYNRRG